MIRINLVPREERGKSQRKVDWSRMSTVLLISVTVLVIALGVFNSVLVNMYQAKLDGMTSDMAMLKARETELRQIKQENANLQKDIQTATSFGGQDNNRRLLATLRGIAEATPDGVWFNDLYVTADQTISGSGLAFRSSDLASLLDNLRAVPAVAAIELPTIGKLGEGSTALQTFTLRMKLEGGQ